MKNNFYTLTVVFLALSSLTGCSLSHLLVGDISPVDQKSDKILVVPVETLDHNWKRINSETPETVTETPDRAWQSTKTAAIISLNSACRKNNSDHDQNLKEITTDMLNQWEITGTKTEREITISGFAALETTAEGMFFSKKRKFQTIVVKTSTCVYDLIYLSSPKSFTQDLGLFQKFHDKLILK